MAGENTYIAEISMVAFNFAPPGWAPCDGQLLPISTNTPLFSILNTNFGGNGITNFGLPDFRGRVPIHQGQRPGFSHFAIGEMAGEENVFLMESELPIHSHSAQLKINIGNESEETLTDNPVNNYPVKQTADPSDSLYSNSASGVMGKFKPEINMQPIPIGGSQAHNNMQPYLTVNFIIALQGVYPPRK